MTKLEQLIKELCPNGIEYKKISAIASVLRGKRLTKNQLSDNNRYPVFHGGLEPLGYYENNNRDAETTMIINVGASAGTVGFSDKPFWASDGCYCISHNQYVIPRFIYLALSCKQKNLMSKVRKAGIPTLDAKIIEDTFIPVPPLEVQAEIVKILDEYTESVTALQQELEAELTARKKQYEYYRDLLLDFGVHGATSECEWRTLGETCIIKSGKAISASQISAIQNDEYPIACFGGNGLRGYVSHNSHSGNCPIIGRQGALCGNVNYAMGDFYATEHAVVVKSKGKLKQRFLYHLLVSMNLNQYKSQGAQPGLAVGNIEKLIIPIPPIKEQERIVAILDRFDKLCNDISEGLPAEIEARKKQYEYYRDKLLSFEEVRA